MGGNPGDPQGGVTGIYAMAAADVFKLNDTHENRQKGLAISISFFEIYGGKVRQSSLILVVCVCVCVCVCVSPCTHSHTLTLSQTLTLTRARSGV